MGLPAEKIRFSAEDFLQWEAEQPERHEYLDDEVFAMAGAEDRHVTVSGNMYMALRQHLAGTPCRTYMAVMRLRVEAANSFHYPDVMVTCSAADTERFESADLNLSHDVLLAEVYGPTLD